MLPKSSNEEDLSNCCYLCNECPNTFSTLNQLQTHLIHNHKSTTTLNSLLAASVSPMKENKINNFFKLLNYNDDHDNSQNNLVKSNNSCKIKIEKQNFVFKEDEYNSTKVNFYFQK